MATAPPGVSARSHRITAAASAVGAIARTVWVSTLKAGKIRTRYTARTTIVAPVPAALATGSRERGPVEGDLFEGRHQAEDPDHRDRECPLVPEHVVHEVAREQG